MNEDFDINNKKEGYSSVVVKIAIACVSLFVLIAAYMIFNNISYLESSIGLFLLFFVIANLVFYMSMVREVISLILISSLCIISSFVFISKSIDWRKNYIMGGFVLEAYIETYPSYFEHLQASFGVGSDIVSFAQECLGTRKEAVQASKRPASCSSFKSIEEHYGVDLKEIIIDYHNKMKRTAEAIANDQLSQIRYPACINQKTCAFVPLPPSNMSPEAIQESDDPQIIVVRDGFWDLVDQGVMTPNTCHNMFLCKRLRDAGILDSDAFAAINQLLTRKNRR